MVMGTDVRRVLANGIAGLAVLVIVVAPDVVASKASPTFTRAATSSGAAPHVHVEVPPEYRGAHVAAAAWTHPAMLARGKEIHVTRCAVCHGESGDGKGPAAMGLPLKPPDLRETRMVNEMTGHYWFWRVTEGAAVEPFRSQGSTMPA